MGQYLPEYYPVSGGSYNYRSNIIDPDLIEREFQRIAFAHNSHSTEDFAPSCITSSVLQCAYSRMIVPFGMRGSWTIAGGATLASNQVSLLIPATGLHINSAKVHAQNFYGVSAGSTAAVRLYKTRSGATSAIAAAVMVNDFDTNSEFSITYTMADPALTLQAGDYLRFRCSVAAGAVLVNVMFYLDCTLAHA